MSGSWSICSIRYVLSARALNTTIPYDDAHHDRSGKGDAAYNHGSVVSQNKRETLGQQGIPPIRSNKLEVAVEPGNIGPLEPEDHRFLLPFPLSGFHSPRSVRDTT